MLFLRHLASYLGPDQPFYALRQQGLDGVRSPHTRVEDMAAHYLQEIAVVQPVGPYLLGGYSFGVLVAYEKARQLEARGQRVALLALIDARFWNAPATPRSLRSQFEFQFRRFRFHVDNILDDGVAGAPGYLLNKLMERISPSSHASTAAPDPVVPPGQPELPPRLVELERLDELATRNYVPQPYRGRVTLFLRRRTTWVDRDDRVLKTVSLGGIEIRKIPGDYFNAIIEPRVRILARKLTACLNWAIASVPAQ